MSEETQDNLPERREGGDHPHVVATRRGMWSRGSGDTSGYDGMVQTVTMGGRDEPPFDDADADAIHSRMLEVLPDVGGVRYLFHRGQLTIYVPREALSQVVATFRDDPGLRFEMCVSVSGVHYPEEAGAELHSVYELLSITHNRRVRLDVSCPDGDPHIPSVVATYPMADYHERETWDMFGIIYDGHPALTRILMPDDWAGHPQRKDYPLGGVDVEYKGARVPSPDYRRTYS